MGPMELARAVSGRKGGAVVISQASNRLQMVGAKIAAPAVTRDTRRDPRLSLDR